MKEQKLDNPRKTIQIIAFEDDSYDHDFPTKPQEFLEWWNDTFDNVPEEYKDSAEISIEPQTELGMPSLLIIVSDSRSETDEEWEKRIESKQFSEATQKKRAIQEVARLTKKFNL